MWACVLPRTCVCAMAGDVLQEVQHHVHRDHVADVLRVVRRQRLEGHAHHLVIVVDLHTHHNQESLAQQGYSSVAPIQGLCKALYADTRLCYAQTVMHALSGLNKLGWSCGIYNKTKLTTGPPEFPLLIAASICTSTEAENSHCQVLDRILYYNDGEKCLLASENGDVLDVC